MKIKLRDNTWSLVCVDLDAGVRGQIDPPVYANKQLKLSTRINKSKDILEVLIHECLHGCFWDLDEEIVDECALDIANALYKLGARIDINKIKKERKTRRK